jgi:hypothetical protein
MMAIQIMCHVWKVNIEAVFSVPESIGKNIHYTWLNAKKTSSYEPGMNLTVCVSFHWGILQQLCQIEKSK